MTRYEGKNVTVWDRDETDWGGGCSILFATFVIGVLVGVIIGLNVASRPTPATAPQPTGSVEVRRSAVPLSPTVATLVVEASASPEPTPTQPSSYSNGRVGILAYASPSLGSRYLAIPIGAGHRVEVCVGSRCLLRVSTDAGPAPSMLRAGRIADVSFVDFAWLCQCDPAAQGTINGSWRLASAQSTVPPTDVTP